MGEYDFRKRLDRNLKGIKLEKAGKVDKAIALYEANIREGFVGNHPYDRLAVIYRKQKRIDDEIRVLERAVEVFEGLLKSPRQDIKPKLGRFREQLKKALSKRKKEE